MARYVRADEDTLVSWMVAYGLTALLLALGFAMTGYINFWLGVAAMAGGVCILMADIWLRHKYWTRTQRIGGTLTVCAAFVIILWFVFIAAPLDVLFDTPAGNYSADREIFGVKWKPEYYPVNIAIGNDTSNDYNNFDGYLVTNVSIAKVGIRKTINQCFATLENPYVRFAFPIFTHIENGKPISDLQFQDDQNTASKFYRIMCGKISTKSEVDIVLATVGGPPLWIAMKAEYFAAGRGRSNFSSACFATSPAPSPSSQQPNSSSVSPPPSASYSLCPTMPKSL
jgi:hypothetical protein